MKIRKAKKEDLKEIADIFRIESAKKPYNTKFTRASALKDIQECFKYDLYVATEEKKIIGFISSHIISSDKNKAYVDELWIRHDYQKNGTGKMLMKFIENKYKKKGLSGMRLVVRKKAKAFMFYKKLKYGESKELFFMDKKLK
ncbi:GNAT family N-acetyltransferase [Methanococcoides sp. SA1]|nr:GNAT family N-acetyltransferase [Methanococcoides sp. SA1]